MFKPGDNVKLKIPYSPDMIVNRIDEVRNDAECFWFNEDFTINSFWFNNELLELVNKTSPVKNYAWLDSEFLTQYTKYKSFDELPKKPNGEIDEEEIIKGTIFNSVRHMYSTAMKCAITNSLTKVLGNK